MLHYRPPPLEADRRDVSKVLEFLRGQNLVFCDLRKSNTLQSQKGSRAFLVDLSGIGWDGEDRYSLLVLHKLHLYPATATRA